MLIKVMSCACVSYYQMLSFAIHSLTSKNAESCEASRRAVKPVEDDVRFLCAWMSRIVQPVTGQCNVPGGRSDHETTPNACQDTSS